MKISKKTKTIFITQTISLSAVLAASAVSISAENNNESGNTNKPYNEQLIEIIDKWYKEDLSEYDYEEAKNYKIRLKNIEYNELQNEITKEKYDELHAKLLKLKSDLEKIRYKTTVLEKIKNLIESAEKDYAIKSIDSKITFYKQELTKIKEGVEKFTGVYNMAEDSKTQILITKAKNDVENFLVELTEYRNNVKSSLVGKNHLSENSVKSFENSVDTIFERFNYNPLITKLLYEEYVKTIETLKENIDTYKEKMAEIFKSAIENNNNYPDKNTELTLWTDMELKKILAEFNNEISEQFTKEKIDIYDKKIDDVFFKGKVKLIQELCAEVESKDFLKIYTPESQTKFLEAINDIKNNPAKMPTKRLYLSARSNIRQAINNNRHFLEGCKLKITRKIKYNEEKKNPHYVKEKAQKAQKMLIELKTRVDSLKENEYFEDSYIEDLKIIKEIEELFIYYRDQAILDLENAKTFLSGVTREFTKEYFLSVINKRISSLKTNDIGEDSYQNEVWYLKEQIVKNIKNEIENQTFLKNFIKTINFDNYSKEEEEKFNKLVKDYNNLYDTTTIPGPESFQNSIKEFLSETISNRDRIIEYLNKKVLAIYTRIKSYSKIVQNRFETARQVLVRKIFIPKNITRQEYNNLEIEVNNLEKILTNSSEPNDVELYLELINLDIYTEFSTNVFVSKVLEIRKKLLLEENKVPDKLAEIKNEVKELEKELVYNKKELLDELNKFETFINDTSDYVRPDSITLARLEADKLKDLINENENAFYTKNVQRTWLIKIGDLKKILIYNKAFLKEELKKLLNEYNKLKPTLDSTINETFKIKYDYIDNNINKETNIGSIKFDEYIKEIDKLYEYFIDYKTKLLNQIKTTLDANYDIYTEESVNDLNKYLVSLNSKITVLDFVSKKTCETNIIEINEKVKNSLIKNKDAINNYLTSINTTIENEKDYYTPESLSLFIKETANISTNINKNDEVSRVKYKTFKNEIDKSLELLKKYKNILLETIESMKVQDESKYTKESIDKMIIELEKINTQVFSMDKISSKEYQDFDSKIRDLLKILEWKINSKDDLLLYINSINLDIYTVSSTNEFNEKIVIIKNKLNLDENNNIEKLKSIKTEVSLLKEKLVLNQKELLDNLNVKRNEITLDEQYYTSESFNNVENEFIKLQDDINKKGKYYFTKDKQQPLLEKINNISKKLISNKNFLVQELEKLNEEFKKQEAKLDANIKNLYKTGYNVLEPKINHEEKFNRIQTNEYKLKIDELYDLFMNFKEQLLLEIKKALESDYDIFSEESFNELNKYLNTYNEIIKSKDHISKKSYDDSIKDINKSVQNLLIRNKENIIKHFNETTLLVENEKDFYTNDSLQTFKNEVKIISENIENKDELTRSEFKTYKQRIDNSLNLLKRFKDILLKTISSMRTQDESKFTKTSIEKMIMQLNKINNQVNDHEKINNSQYNDYDKKLRDLSKLLLTYKDQLLDDIEKLKSDKKENDYKKKAFQKFTKHINKKESQIRKLGDLTPSSYIDEKTSLDKIANMLNDGAGTPKNALLAFSMLSTIGAIITLILMIIKKKTKH
ncbi:hypothetical protein [Mycoplasma crocodyli]|uniref:Uncharacterized protein n=1 Tax=Mycoplasma crocodyli (strain ATCC 51981 / MP145) TaxID=512564 RepID=D5E5R2_MYCCM|nr:hypothetical protein [Mycoplasma crocodyli]ADE19871.1 hypothetical protein MCRO_0480 [Mycoplasma crocodyli MP145]